MSGRRAKALRRAQGVTVQQRRTEAEARPRNYEIRSRRVPGSLTDLIYAGAFDDIRYCALCDASLPTDYVVPFNAFSPTIHPLGDDGDLRCPGRHYLVRFLVCENGCSGEDALCRIMEFVGASGASEWPATSFEDRTLLDKDGNECVLLTIGTRLPWLPVICERCPRAIPLERRKRFPKTVTCSTDCMAAKRAVNHDIWASDDWKELRDHERRCREREWWAWWDAIRSAA